tara:strand:- start:751 stop:936 length:186 start_codon:yes stop_codon:yes gene_type:complete
MIQLEYMYPYLISAGCLALCAGSITYCASNWDNPPDWWPDFLQPKWNVEDKFKRIKDNEIV